MKGDYDKYKVTISHSTWRKIQELELDIDYWSLRKMLSDLGSLILEEVLTNTRGFNLPYSFGHLRMVGSPPSDKRSYITKMKSLDYIRTDNMIYRMVWFTKKTKLKNIVFYSINTPKLMKMEITRRIRQDGFFKWQTVSHRSLVFKINDY